MHYPKSSFRTKLSLNQFFFLFSLNCLFSASPVLAQGLVGQPVDPSFCGGMRHASIADTSVKTGGASVIALNTEPDQTVIFLTGITVLIFCGLVQWAKSTRSIPGAPYKSDLAQERAVTALESKRLVKLACPMSLLRRTMSTNVPKRNPCSASGRKQSCYRIHRTANNE
jgi:hypothetical protein